MARKTMAMYSSQLGHLFYKFFHFEYKKGSQTAHLLVKFLENYFQVVSRYIFKIICCSTKDMLSVIIIYMLN